MNQEKSSKPQQVFYINRWVDKQNFRVFVYNEAGQRLANSYEEYEKLIMSGLWFSEKDKLSPKKGRKPRLKTLNSVDTEVEEPEEILSEPNDGGLD
jgi:hypothetical protein